MVLADVASAAAIERAAYGPQHVVTITERELTTNRLARFVAVEEAGAPLCGFAGIWCIVDQSHIVTVAVDPAQQSHGLGRLLVHALIMLSRSEGMESSTLEVRPDNAAALRLYRDYGFYEVGRRERYYPDGSDALIMTTEDLASPAYEQRLERLSTVLRERLPGAVLDIEPGPPPAIAAS